MKRITVAALLCLAAACANAPRPTATPNPTSTPTATVRDAFVARVEALALLQTLNADLLSHDSATQTLERWCGDHRLASPAKIVAERVQGVEKAPTSEQRAELKVGPTEQVRYRRVRLRCGALVLSEADNWYVPSRLTPQMNDLLESTDTPFGKVVLPLHFQRHTLSATLLWLPLSKGWEMQRLAGERLAGERPAGGRPAGGGPAGEVAAGGPVVRGDATPFQVPDKVLEHRAVLLSPDGMPISEVVETYTGNVLAFLVVNP